MEKWKKPAIVELHSQSTEADNGRGKSKGKGKPKLPPAIGRSGILPRGF